MSVNTATSLPFRVKRNTEREANFILHACDLINSRKLFYFVMGAKISKIQQKR